MTLLTIEIDDVLYQKALSRTTAEGTSLADEIQSFLAHYAEAADAGHSHKQHLPVLHGSGGLRLGIDPANNKSMRMAADE